MLPIAPADELRKQAEKGDLDRSIRGGLELEESGGGGVHSQEPEAYGGTREMGADLLVGPLQAIHPPIGAAHLGVEIPGERGRGRLDALDARGPGRAPRPPEGE